ncbi:MAG: type II toxin-antitoxin system PemK/MazF family toxin [Treponema sp.]|jgi:mRNA interferase MazF|nr:type II toxin-antitoxin system PemK/MazF family toxin [Treponema sp.]
MVHCEIWQANLPRLMGSKPVKRRPLLIIQSDSFNRSCINTVICAVITSNIELVSLTGNLLLEKSISCLEKTPDVNFSQIAAPDKTDLTEQSAMLPKFMLEKMNKCLKLVPEMRQQQQYKFKFAGYSLIRNQCRLTFRL